MNRWHPQLDTNSDGRDHDQQFNQLKGTTFAEPRADGAARLLAASSTPNRLLRFVLNKYCEEHCFPQEWMRKKHLIAQPAPNK